VQSRDDLLPDVAPFFEADAIQRIQIQRLGQELLAGLGIDLRQAGAHVLEPPAAVIPGVRRADGEPARHGARQADRRPAVAVLTHGPLVRRQDSRGIVPQRGGRQRVAGDGQLDP
jgi:hypothetical protein